MNRIHALTITLIVAIAVTVGGTAMSRSGASGAAPAAAATTNANDQALNRAIAKRAKALDALQASLNEQLAAPAPTPASGFRTVRVQAPPVVVTRRPSGSESSDEHQGGVQDD